MKQKNQLPQPPQQEATSPSNLRRVVAQLNKKYGESTIGVLSEMKNISIDRVPTGINVLDSIVGGGFPKGGIVELFGAYSSGKSLISFLTIKKAQELGLDCVFLDCENSFDPEFATKLGVDMKKLIVTQVSIGEDVIDLIADLLKAQPGLIVLDSIASMITRAELTEPMDTNFMAVRARLLSRGLAKINALNKKTLIILINQIRNTLQLYGSPTTSVGGNALRHYVSCKIEVKQGDKLTVDNKKTGDVIGQTVNLRVVKNKVGQPWKQGSFKFFYEDCRIEE